MADTVTQADTFKAAHGALSGAITYLMRDEAPTDGGATFRAISILLHARERLAR